MLDGSYGYEAFAAFHAKAWHRLEQGSEVRVTGFGEKIWRGATLDNTTVVHHNHGLRHIGHDTEIMRNQQQGHLEFCLKIADEIQYLSLNRDIKSGSRLVSNQKGRPADECHRNHGSLTKAP